MQSEKKIVDNLKGQINMLEELEDMENMANGKDD